MSGPVRAPVQVVRHVCFEDLGALAGELGRRGLRFDYATPSEGGALDGLEDAGLLLVLGGPLSANDTDRYPYLGREIEIIRRRVERGLPTLGICLGAQLIARAMGAGVAPMPAPEIGWAPLELAEAGGAGLLRRLRAPVLHWHGEAFELPPGCETLASTAKCSNQAFAVEDHTLALQFHIEVRAGELERWLAGHVHELDHRSISVPGLREDGRRFAREAAAQGAALFSDWLAGLGNGP